MAIRTLGPKDRALAATALAHAPQRVSLLKKVHLFLQREQVIGYTLIASAFLLLAVLVAWSFCMALYCSLTERRCTTGP